MCTTISYVSLFTILIITAAHFTLIHSISNRQEPKMSHTHLLHKPLHSKPKHRGNNTYFKTCPLGSFPQSTVAFSVIPSKSHFYRIYSPVGYEFKISAPIQITAIGVARNAAFAISDPQILSEVLITDDKNGDTMLSFTIPTTAPIIDGYAYLFLNSTSTEANNDPLNPNKSWKGTLTPFINDDDHFIVSYRPGTSNDGYVLSGTANNLQVSNAIQILQGKMSCWGAYDFGLCSIQDQPCIPKVTDISTHLPCNINTTFWKYLGVNFMFYPVDNHTCNYCPYGKFPKVVNGITVCKQSYCDIRGGCEFGLCVGVNRCECEYGYSGIICNKGITYLIHSRGKY